MATSKNTIPYLNKYERAAIISARAAEIANGPSTIENPKTIDPIEIARLEFEAKKLPKKIVRVYPDGSVEIWSLADFNKLN